MLPCMRIEYSNSQDLSNSNDSAKERPGGQSLLGENDISLKLRRLATQIAEMHSRVRCTLWAFTLVELLLPRG